MTDRRRTTWQDFQPAPGDGPPIDVLPGYMDSSHVLALTDDVVIAAGSFRVWDIGFLFTLSVRLSPRGFANLPEPTFAWFRPEEPTRVLGDALAKRTACIELDRAASRRPPYVPAPRWSQQWALL